MSYLKKAITAADLGALTQQPPVCDFCGEHAPAWLYAADRMSTGARVQCWRWAACPECSELVDADAWFRMVERLAARLTEPGPILLKMAAAAVSLGEFHEHAIRQETDQ